MRPPEDGWELFGTYPRDEVLGVVKGLLTTRGRGGVQCKQAGRSTTAVYVRAEPEEGGEQ